MTSENSNYLLYGINHKSAPVALREKLALRWQDPNEFLDHVLAINEFEEAAVLSTCNRFELYGVTKNIDSHHNGDLIQACFQLEGLDQHVYNYVQHDAVNHLFRVTSSLDSMIVGENQIVQQVKEAYQVANTKKTAGSNLHRLFHTALHVAKRVKTETGIGEGQVSVGSVAVQLAKKIFEDLSQCQVVLFGAGEVGQLTVQHLKSSRSQIKVVNRDYKKAQLLEEQGYGESVPLERFSEIMIDTDILISSISGQSDHLSHESFARLMDRRQGRALFVIDLSVPRSVPDSVSHLANIYLYNIDDLKEVADDNRRFREEQLKKAKMIVTQEAQNFLEKTSSVWRPAVVQLNQKFEDLRQRELKKTLAKLSHLSEDEKKAIEQLTKSLMSKALHDPILLLRDEQAMAEPSTLSFFKKVFRLDREDENEF